MARKRKPPKLGSSKRPRRRRIRRVGEPTAIELIEEGVHLLRQVPLHYWSIYMMGAAPFIVSFLFFWTEMATSGLARQVLVPGAFGLAALFIWMKVTQSYFGRGLRVVMLGAEDAGGWGLAEWLKVVRRQAVWQPSGLVVVPIAMVVTIPFAWVFAFYQSMLLSDPRDSAGEREVMRESWRLGRLWPEQNWSLLMLLSLVFLFSIVNWLTVLTLAPFLLKTLLGIETIFSKVGANLVNSTSMFACCLLAYLVTDPLVKAVFLLRHHYCESRRSGDDLRLRWRQSLRRGGENLPKVALWVVAALMLGPILDPSSSALEAREANAVGAEVQAVDPDQFDATIGEVLERREFVWRFPREELSDDAAKGWLAEFFEQIERWREAFMLWLEELFSSKEKSGSQRNWDGLVGLGEGLSYLIIFLFVVALLYFGFRAWRQFQPQPILEGVSETDFEVVPDLEAEDVSADQLPRNRWLEMARACIGRGEYRLALRAYFLAQLSDLSEAGLIVLQRAKTNREYAREIAGRAHGRADLSEIYDAQRRLFEAVWYGDHVSGPEQIGEMEGYLGRTGVLS